MDRMGILAVLLALVAAPISVVPGVTTLIGFLISLLALMLAGYSARNGKTILYFVITALLSLMPVYFVLDFFYYLSLPIQQGERPTCPHGPSEGPCGPSPAAEMETE